ncbi:MAG: dockerin type I domain-containing protein [Clostridiales bacterium]|nr:dockerin type I domain-containing protein [Clostridiales bacterium]
MKKPAKKFLSILAAVAMVVCLIGGTGLTGLATTDTDSTWYDADETEFTISSASELAALAEIVNSGQDTFSEKTVTLDADEIDMSSYDSFAGIGNSSYSFAGTFDGGECTVTVSISTTDSAALFPYVNGAVIENLTVAGSVTTTGTAGAGAIVGVTGTDGVTIENCENQAAVTGVGYVGGLVGNAGTGMTTISGSVNNGTVVSTAMYTGGVIGYVAAGTISDVDNYGDVDCTVSSGGTAYAGGIAGYAFASTTYGSLTISDCLNYGGISSNGEYGGGITGYASGTDDTSYVLSILRCGNEGSVAPAKTAGGIAGRVEGSSSVLQSLYNAGAVSVNYTSGTYAGGIVGTTYGAFGMTDVYNVGTVTTNLDSQYAGGIIGNNSGLNESGAPTIKNAYNAGTVTMGSGSTSVGSLIGYLQSRRYVYVSNVYYISLSGDDDNPDTLCASGNTRVYSSDTSAAITDEEAAEAIVDADTLKGMASTLNEESFEDNPDNTYTYHLGYPILVWEVVPSEEEEELDGAASVNDGTSTTCYDTVEEAFTYANTLETDSTITLLEDCETGTTLTTASGQTITLDLAGYTLSAPQTSFPVLTVNGTLTLTDSGENGTVTGGKSGSGGGVYVASGGELIQNGGVITGNTAGSYGGGVYVVGDYTMNGGSVSANEAGTYGGGIYVEGSVVLNGGSVSENTSGTYGGGIYVKKGGSVAVAENGNISGNETGTSGGGVYVTGGSFTMTGGEVSENTSIRYGAGVYLTSSSTFTISDGTISGNAVAECTATSAAGGGIYLSGGTFTMSGGEITGNTIEATDSSLGAGVYATGSYTAYLSGTPVISENTVDGTENNYYLANGKTITLADGLAKGASIGVTSAVTPKASAAVQVTAAETGTSYYETAIEYISSDSGYDLRSNESGYIELYVPASVYMVSTNLTNLTCSGEASASNAEDYTATLTPESGYELSEEITVTVGGETLDSSSYSYSVVTGILTLSSDVITGDIVITAQADLIPSSPEQDEDSYYLLCSEDDVLWLQSRVLRGTTDINARVASDIVMSSGFTGIGTASYPYEGTLDGDGYTITLEISTSSAAGLFSYANGAVIRDLITAGSVESTSNYIGGLLGYAGNNGVTVENCVNQASVSGQAYVAGLVGYCIGQAQISGSSNEGTITATGNYTGGILGYCNYGSITDTTNNGAVNGVGYLGGIQGYTSVSASKGCGMVIEYCVNYGAVTGTGTRVGGIIGSAQTSSTVYVVEIQRCGNEGPVASSGSNSSGVGGIVGYCSGYANILESLYNAGSISGTTQMGGIVGSVNCSLVDVYNVGDVTGTGQQIGGILGNFGNVTAAAQISLSNVYNAGAVTGGSAASYVGILAGKLETNTYLYEENVYYLSTLSGSIVGSGESYLYSISTGEVLTDDDKTAMQKSSDELIALASVLNGGDEEGSFKDNTNSDYHLGYPVLAWEEIPAVDETVEYVLGDVDGDGSVTAYDVTWLARYIAGVELDFDIDSLASDINVDGSVTAQDLTLLARYIAGLDEGYGIGETMTTAE